MIFHIILTVLMLLVIVFDARSYRIPNWLVAIVLAVYPIFVLLAPQPVAWIPALILALAAFAVGFGLFAFKLMGGGDVKLLAACCLWTGLDTVVPFLLYTAFLGGLMAVFFLLMRPVAGYYAARICPQKILPKILLPKEPLPYGIAIAGAFLALLWLGKLPGLGI